MFERTNFLIEPLHNLNLKDSASRPKDHFNGVGKLLDFVRDILLVDVEILLQMKIDIF